MGARTIPGESLRWLCKWGYSGLGFWHWRCSPRYALPHLVLRPFIEAPLLDAKVKESPRAIHDIAMAPVSPYSFVSGSADGCIRLWDWRERKGPVYIVAHQHASVRSLVFGPFADTQLNIVAGLDSGMLFRYDLRVSYAAAGQRLMLTRPSIASNI